MAYDTLLVQRVREYLVQFPEYEVTEKKMFGGLALLVNGKMCVNVSGQKLMCRFDPKESQEIQSKLGYLPMIMRGKELQGYCYVEPYGFDSDKDFEFWLNLCLAYNSKAKSSKKNIG